MFTHLYACLRSLRTGQLADGVRRRENWGKERESRRVRIDGEQQTRKSKAVGVRESEGGRARDSEYAREGARGREMEDSS
jgi:hypothetical protein